MQDQIKLNAEIFQNAMKMFMPFGVPGMASPEATKETAVRKDEAKDDLSDLKEQIAAMQRKLESISKG
jgi:polyhydroxyalkanoate synthesis regulator protein